MSAPATAPRLRPEGVGAPRDELARVATERVVLAIALGVFALAVLRTAWICDDAYINFRTIDNFLHGYGLRWNVAERVQTFTDPLWLFLVAAAVALTREFYFTTIGVSLAASAAAIGLYAKAVAADRLTAVVGVMMLVCSKAFVDYSTGGLENPLAHLLIVVFLAVYWRARDPDGRTLGWLTAVAALCTLTRMDSVVLLVPALAATAAAVGLRKSVVPVAFGAAPLIVWELFSILYYGQPLPNTAYAKLGGGIPRFELAEQGAYYLLDSITRDPLTLTIIGTAIVAPLIIRDSRVGPVALGIVLSVSYVVAIGGDFMSGRFLAAPFLCSVAVLTRVSWRVPRNVLVFPVSLVLVAAASSQSAPLTTDRTFHHDFQDRSGTVDERRVYYQYTGLLNAGAGGAMQHPWALHAREVIEAGDRVTTYIANGFFGFTLGRQVHVIDPMALSDVLLARLPAGPDWRPGHFPRRVPEGYAETLASGENRIAEPGIAALYETVRLIVSGPLFSKARLKAIWRLNTSGYAASIDQTSYGVQRLNLTDVSAPLPEGTSLYHPGVRQIREGGIDVAFDRPVTTGRIEMSADGNDDYLIIYKRGGRDVCHQLVRARSPHTDGSLGLAVHVLEPPACAAGVDRIAIHPRHGFGPAFLGHIRLLP